MCTLCDRDCIGHSRHATLRTGARLCSPPGWFFIGMQIADTGRCRLDIGIVAYIQRRIVRRLIPLSQLSRYASLQSLLYVTDEYRLNTRIADEHATLSTPIYSRR